MWLRSIWFIGSGASAGLILGLIAAAYGNAVGLTLGVALLICLLTCAWKIVSSRYIELLEEIFEEEQTLALRESDGLTWL